MSDLHVSRELLDAVFEGRRTVSDLAPVLLSHLLDLCPRCKLEYEAYEAALEESGESLFLPLIPPEYDVPDGEEDLPPELRTRIEDARGRLRELLALPADEQLQAITRTPRRFRGPLLAGLLIDECRERLPGRPKEAHTLAQLAKAVLEHGDPHPLTIDLYARAIAYGASALRAQGQVRRAAEIFRQARFLLKEEGGGDRYTRAELDWLEGALRRDQRNLVEAERLLMRAVLGFRMERDATSAARALLTLGMVYREQDSLDRAIEVTQEALELIDAKSEPRLRFYAIHNMATWLCEVGDFRSARETLESTRAAQQSYPHPPTHLRLVWVEAKIARGLGEAENAEAGFLSALDGFFREGNAYDAALVSLELATLYAEDGRPAEVRALAEETIAVFEDQEVHREVLAALILFRDAARAESLNLAFLHQLTAYFERARLDPDLSFQQPS